MLIFEDVPEENDGEATFEGSTGFSGSLSFVDLPKVEGTAMTTVINLGGRFTGERHDYDEGVVVVMADPEDHEFCLVQYYG